MKFNIVGLTLNYRDPDRTSRCVASLLDEGTEHVLVWDNSADDGRSVHLLRRRWSGDSPVTIQQSPHNLGFAAGVNQGVEWLCRHRPGAWIMLINNDAVLRPGALNLLAQALLENPQAGLAYPSVNHGGRVLSTMYYHRWGGWITTRSLPGAFPYPSGSALLIAPERLELPVFDERFFMYGEDWLLGYRLGAKRMAHVPEVLVDHEGSASSRMGSVFYETRMVTAHWLLARLLARNAADRLLLMMGRMISLPARALLRSLRYRSVVPWRALWQGWRLAQGGDPDWQRAKKASVLLRQR